MSTAATEDSNDELTEAYELLMKGHWCRGESDSDMVKSNDECIVIAVNIPAFDHLFVWFPRFGECQSQQRNDQFSKLQLPPLQPSSAATLKFSQLDWMFCVENTLKQLNIFMCSW